MTKVNEKFIQAMQKRLDEKFSEYDGENNPKYYKNMPISSLNSCLYSQMVEYQRLMMQFRELDSLELVQKKLCNISNFCWMLWERLERNEK